MHHAAGRLSPTRSSSTQQPIQANASHDFEEESRRVARARQQFVEQRRQDARKLEQEARAARRGGTWTPPRNPQVMQRAEEEIKLAEMRLAAGDSVHRPHSETYNEHVSEEVKTSVPVVRPPTDAYTSSESLKVKTSVPVVRPPTTEVTHHVYTSSASLKVKDTSPKRAYASTCASAAKSSCTSPGRSLCTSPKRVPAEQNGECSSALGPLTWAVERRRTLRMLQRSRQAYSLTSPPRRPRGNGGNRLKTSQTPPAPVTSLGNRQRPGSQTPPVTATLQPLLSPPVPAPSQPIQHFIGSASCSEADEEDWALEAGLDHRQTWLDPSGFDQFVDIDTGLNDSGFSFAPVHEDGPPQDCCSSHDPVGQWVDPSSAPPEATSGVLRENPHMRAIEDALKKSELAVQRSLAVRQAMLAKKRSHQTTESASHVAQASQLVEQNALQKKCRAIDRRPDDVHNGGHELKAEFRQTCMQLEDDLSSACSNLVSGYRDAESQVKLEIQKVTAQLESSELSSANAVNGPFQQDLQRKERTTFIQDPEEVSFCSQTHSPQQESRNFRLQAWVTKGFVLGGA